LNPGKLIVKYPVDAGALNGNSGSQLPIRPRPGNDRFQYFPEVAPDLLNVLFVSLSRP